MTARPYTAPWWVAPASIAVVLTAYWIGQAEANTDHTRTPTPTVTRTVTPPPVTETVTVRVTQRASRSEVRTTAPTTQRIVRPDTSGAVVVMDELTPWQRDYWRKAQAWAATSKARAVVMCESTNNPRAVSRTGKYRGVWQFDARTWASYGGLDVAARPDLASRAAQNYVAFRLYTGRGWAPWTCA